MPDGDELRSFVERLSLRSSMTKDERAAFLALPYKAIVYERGTVLVREDDPAERCCILLSGFAYRQRSTRRGARQIVSFHIPGDPVDFQNSLFGRADHSVRALTEVRVALVPKSAIEQVIVDFPNLGRALWYDTLIETAGLREWLISLGQRNAIQRLAHLLCEMAVRQSQAGVTTLPDIHWPMTQEQVGDATGLTAVHVNRTFRRLREDEIVSVAHGSATVLDWSALRDIAEFDESYLGPIVTA